MRRKRFNAGKAGRGVVVPTSHLSHSVLPSRGKEINTRLGMKARSCLCTRGLRVHKHCSNSCWFIPSADLLAVTAARSCLIWASGSQSLMVHVLFLERQFHLATPLRKKERGKKKKGVERFWSNTYPHLVESELFCCSGRDVQL